MAIDTDADNPSPQLRWLEGVRQSIEKHPIVWVLSSFLAMVGTLDRYVRPLLPRPVWQREFTEAIERLDRSLLEHRQSIVGADLRWQQLTCMDAVQHLKSLVNYKQDSFVPRAEDIAGELRKLEKKCAAEIDDLETELRSIKAKLVEAPKLARR